MGSRPFVQAGAKAGAMMAGPQVQWEIRGPVGRAGSLGIPWPVPGDAGPGEARNQHPESP